MGTVGSLLNDAIDSGVESIFGLSSEQHSTIDKFMSKFNNTSQHSVDQIDSLNTFDCIFEFWPGTGEKETKKGFIDKVLDNGMTVLNNAIGGLAEQIIDAFGEKNDITSQRNKFMSQNKGKASFLNYLAVANLMEVEKGPHYTLDMSYYIQNIQTPGINIQTGESINTIIGNFTVTGNCTTPQQNTLNMEIMNTKAPIIERIFYPWMKEISTPVWFYDTQPFTTADITVSMTKHADVKYIFVGARPTMIDTYKPSQELNGSPTRGVTFTFDYMFITSELKTKTTLADTLTGLAKGVVNDVAGTFGL